MFDELKDLSGTNTQKKKKKKRSTTVDFSCGLMIHPYSFKRFYLTKPAGRVCKKKTLPALCTVIYSSCSDELLFALITVSLQHHQHCLKISLVP